VFGTAYKQCPGVLHLHTHPYFSSNSGSLSPCDSLSSGAGAGGARRLTGGAATGAFWPGVTAAAEKSTSGGSWLLLRNIRLKYDCTIGHQFVKSRNFCIFLTVTLRTA
jgi:hypothetical protein